MSFTSSRNLRCHTGGIRAKSGAASKDTAWPRCQDRITPDSAMGGTKPRLEVFAGQAPLDIVDSHAN